MSKDSINSEIEFVIIGQDQGTSYTLWDAAPAPTDSAKRATLLEELGVEAMDACGSVNTEWGIDARTAVDKLLADLRRQSGLDTYGLSGNSNLATYGPVGDGAPRPELFGTAEALAAAGTGVYRLEGVSAPGIAAFNLTGLPDRYHAETRDRVRAGIVNGGLTGIQTNVSVKVTGDAPGGSSLDLAIACTVLAATGQLPAPALAGVALIGELGLDGRLRPTRGLRDQVRAAVDAGVPAVLVPDANVTGARDVDGIRVLGASTLGEALTLLADHAHHLSDCLHCGDRGGHAPCTELTPCPGCVAMGVEPGDA
ncbi:magnesium chelatase domain-containing protein [Streptomyces sp. BH104]|uniref:magnesium chelatase domain-containing protein n=1 Tax=Streptomyces sp. BH104 TaxID=3410407 RepID=UPI003BB655B9